MTHEFLQVGTEYGRCYLTTTDGTFLGTHTTMKMNITSFTIEKLKSRLSGYGVNEATKNSMLNDIRQSPYPDNLLFNFSIVKLVMFIFIVVWVPKNVSAVVVK